MGEKPHRCAAGTPDVADSSAEDAERRGSDGGERETEHKKTTEGFSLKTITVN